jgi:hypothetical protein
MDRKRVVTACLYVAILGFILSLVVMYAAHVLNQGGMLDQGGSLYNTLLISPLAFLMLFCVSLSFYPSPINAKKNQSLAEQDSSLV